MNEQQIVKLKSDIRNAIEDDINDTLSKSREDYSTKIGWCYPPEIEDIMELVVPSSLSEEQFKEVYNECLEKVLEKVFG